MSQHNLTRILSNIGNCDDPALLRRYMKNAKDRDMNVVYEAAFERLIAVQPSVQVGTVAHDVWRSVHALEEIRTEEERKTVRLSRTRQAIRNKGEIRTVLDLVRKRTASSGFCMLKQRDRLELSFEALVVAREEYFPADAVRMAGARLESCGVDLERVCSYWADG